MGNRKTCVHYWKIEPPTEPESAGVCARCGQFRTFKNALSERSDITNWKTRTR